MNKNPIYFVGIGGIGMSAVAQYFLAQGHLVAGYDRTLTPLIEKLRGLGAHITDNESPSEIPQNFRKPKQKLIVI